MKLNIETVLGALFLIFIAVKLFQELGFNLGELLEDIPWLLIIGAAILGTILYFAGKEATAKILGWLPILIIGGLLYYWLGTDNVDRFGKGVGGSMAESVSSGCEAADEHILPPGEAVTSIRPRGCVGLYWSGQPGCTYRLEVTGSTGLMIMNNWKAREGVPGPAYAGLPDSATITNLTPRANCGVWFMNEI